MNDEQLQKNLGKIEKLIIEGNKEVIAYVDKKIEEVKLELGGKIDEVKQELGGKIGGLDRKVDRIDNTLNATAQASYGLLTDVQKDVKEVKATLDKHVRLPVHA
jgi:DNA repair exonuclease SbcCD ATPase subunit